MKRFLRLYTVLVACYPSLAFGQGRLGTTPQVNQVPNAVVDGSAKLVGPYDPKQMLRLVFGLQPPHLAEEEQFLVDLHTKGSPQFHHFLTAEEWNARFAPAAADEQAVAEWAQAQGLTVTQRYANRLVVDVEAPVATIERALNVKINMHQQGARTYFSNDRVATIPSHLAGVIHSVQGLNNLQVLHSAGKGAVEIGGPIYSPGPMISEGPAATKQGDPAAFEAAKRKPRANLTDIGGIAHLDPMDIYSSEAYNFLGLGRLGHCCNPGLNASGPPPEASIAIAASGGFDPKDMAGFLAEYPYLTSDYRVLKVAGTSPPNSGLEVTMDLEWATATSNSFGLGATSRIWVYEGVNGNTATFIDMFQSMVNQGYARVMTISWGCAEKLCWDPASMDTAHGIFNQMVGQGWTLVASSGDGGATAALESDANGKHSCSATNTVQYPASDPDVVAAGGTQLTLNTDSSYLSEIGWTGSLAPGSCARNAGGSGGGNSVYFASPAYQSKIPNNVGARSIPDMALNAFSGQAVYYQGSLSGDGGGTSIVAPELAGFFAQENAYLLYLGNICGNNGASACAPVGNPNYYYYDNPYQDQHPFYDITEGCNSNDVTESYHLLYFCAGPGYDRVTGWGSINALHLAWSINSALYGFGVPPTVSVTGPAVNHWYNSTQTVSWTVSDAGGGSRVGAPPKTSIAGSTADWDATILTGVIPSTPGPENWFNLGPQIPNSTGGSLQLAAQGCHTLHVAAWLNTGETNGTDQTYGPICYDSIAPVTTVSLLPSSTNAWHTSTVQVVLIGNDAGGHSGTGSGVNITYYSIDNAACAPGSVGGCAGFPMVCPTFGCPKVNISTEGVHHLYVFSQDLAGNNEVRQDVVVNIDETAPHTTAALASLNGGQAVQVTLTATDNLSGVATTVYQLDDGPVKTYGGPFVVIAPGTHTVSLHSIDFAGNVEATQSDSFTITAPLAVSTLLITKSHTGTFSQGQTGATYTITVANVGASVSNGTVAVNDTIPAGLTMTAMSGNGWTCSGTSCHRSDPLAIKASYPVITVTVNVAPNAPSSVTNMATVSANGAANVAYDVTIVQAGLSHTL